MKLFNFVLALLAHSWALGLVAAQQWPLHNNGLNKVVEWDHYSYIINGERLFIWSGEMHYWRAPVPEMWIDIIQKVKAAGFNTISFYGNWAYHSAKDGEVDFENGAHDFERLFVLAKEAGLYCLFRPGPYINAETSGGGYPGWLTTGAYGALRNNDTRYTDAWTPYMTEIAKIVARHQVTNGGNVFIYQIENEYGYQWENVASRRPNYTAIEYMELLEDNARTSGIDVPLIANNPNMRTKAWSKDFSNVGGEVDNYGLDHYPSCWSCNLSECTGTNGAVPDFTVFDYFTNFQEVAPTQPSFLAEFQGGSYNPWGGPQGGCVNNTGPNWVNVFYRNNIAQKATAMNVYMLFGGTSWGGLPMPGVATSYDYSAPIRESRVIREKYQETKLFGQFVRVARDLTKVERVGNGSHYASTSDISTTELRNVDTNGAFYINIHTYSPSTELTSLKLKVSTSIGNLTIPQHGKDIALNGREAKIIVTDFAIGKEKLIYSTAEVLTVSVQDGKPIVFLWLPAGESGEFLIAGAKSGSVHKQNPGCKNISFEKSKSGTAAYYTQAAGTCVLEFSNGVRVVIVDRAAAYGTWVPSLSADPYTPENSTVVVQGPYLVRTAEIDGKTLKLTGDWVTTTKLEIYAPQAVDFVKFNEKNIKVKVSPYGSLIGTLGSSSHSVESIHAALPPLTEWKVNDGLPERNPSYDDSKWIDANHNSTSLSFFRKPATYPVLFADEYGYHTGNLLWRGKFSSSNATGVYLSVIGGTSSGWSAFLNGVHIGSYAGTNYQTEGALTISFTNTTLQSENVLLVIQDHMGKDQTSGVLNPRGITNATLLGGGSFTSWKVAGTAGGGENIDPIRGPYNEGGLHAERLGWHLPGFKDDDWKSGSPETGISEVGAAFYRTVVPLDIPKGVDVSLGFVLDAPKGSVLRAQLYVNGYMYGKFIPHIGNQIEFPVFPGILDYDGENTIGLSIWSQDAAMPARVSVKWTVLGVVESSFDPGFEADYLRPGWTDRSAYY